MHKRDTFMEQGYWDCRVRDVEATIAKFEAMAAAPTTTEDHRLNLRYSIFRERLELVIACYSQGESILALSMRFPSVINALAAIHLQPDHERMDLRIPDRYVHSLWLLSLAILLDVNPGDIEILVDLLGNFGEDGLFDRLVALCVTRRPIATHLLHPRPYAFLYRAINAVGDEQSDLIIMFLNHYYRGMRHTYWYDRHLRPQAGFFGYWCFELAAFVKRLGIQDAKFSHNIYYPRDLVGAN